MQAVVRSRHVRGAVVAHRQVVASAVARQRGLEHARLPAARELVFDARFDRPRQLVAMLEVRKLSAVERTAHHGRVVRAFAAGLEMKGQQDLPVGKIDPLARPHRRVEEFGIVRHGDDFPRRPRSLLRIVDRVGGARGGFVLADLHVHARGVLLVANGRSGPQQLAGMGVPLGREIADDDLDAVRFIPPAQRRVFERRRPGLAQVVGAHFIDRDRKCRSP